MTNLHKIIRLVCSQLGHMEAAQTDLAIRTLQEGGVIALPTDTLYGIAAKVSDTTALERIYKIKGRDSKKPLAVCVSSIESIKEVAETSTLKTDILRSLLPGPITIVLKRSKNLNKSLNPGLDLIGVRVVDHCFITHLCQQVGPLALTSANKSGQKSPVDVCDFEEIWEDLDLVFDSGELRKTVIESDAARMARSGSTVVDLSDETSKRYRIIRDGCALNRVINTLTMFGYLRKVEPKTET